MTYGEGVTDESLLLLDECTLLSCGFALSDGTDEFTKLGRHLEKLKYI